MRRNESGGKYTEVSKKAGTAAKDIKKGWDTGLPTDIGEIITGIFTGKSPEYAGAAAKTLWNQISPGQDDHSLTLSSTDLKNLNSSMKAASRDHRAQVKKERDAYVNRIVNPTGWKTQIGSYYRRSSKRKSGDFSRGYGNAQRKSPSYGSYKGYSKQSNKYNSRTASYTGRRSTGGARRSAPASRIRRR